MDDPDVFFQVKFVYSLQETIHVSGILRRSAFAQILRHTVCVFFISRIGWQTGSHQRRKLFPLPAILAAPGNEPPYTQRERGGIPGRSLSGTDAGKIGSVVA